MDWKRILPFAVVSFSKTALRAIIGVTLIFGGLFLCWFVAEFLWNLKSLLSRSLFGHNW